MKRSLVTFLVIGLLTSCSSVKLQSIKYSNKEVEEGIVYKLPKNLIKVEITYSIKEPYEIVNGIEKKLEKTEAIVVIDKPITITSKLIADETNSYVLTGDRISNDFFTKSTLEFNLTQDGILKSIDTDIEDVSPEFAEKVILSAGNISKTLIAPQSEIASQLNSELSLLMTQLSNLNAGEPQADNLNSRIQEILAQLLTLDYDSKLLSQIVLLNDEFILNNNKDSLNIIASKIKHLQEQIDWYQKRNKTYFKSKKIKYTSVIDPFIKYTRDEIKTNVNKTIYSHLIKPKNIFPSSVKESNIPVIKVSIEKKHVAEFKLPKEIDGIVVRHPSSSKIDLEVDNNLYGSEIIYLAQLGNITIIPVKSKRAGKVKTSLKFDETTGAISQHKIEATSGSSKIGKTLENSTKTIQETIDYLQFEKEIKRLEALKKESELENQVFDLNNTELSRELSQLELNEKILLLKKKIDELSKEEAEETDFEKTLKELEQQQKLLELEVLIKNLKEQLENIGN